MAIDAQPFLSYFLIKDVETVEQAMEAMEELLQFLDINGRIELKTVALENILGLTGSEDGIRILSKSWNQLFPLLVKIAGNDKSELLRKDASLALINLSANKESALKMVEMGENSEKLVKCLWTMIDESVFPSADPACMILCNLTIDKDYCDKVHDCLKRNEISIQHIVDKLCMEDTNNSEDKKPALHYLGPFLSNLSQLSEVREQLLSKGCLLLSRLLPFTEYKGSRIRRGGAIGAIRNCCFDTSIHEMLLTKMDLLSRLLLPLCGPTPDELEDIEVEKLPIDLQYLDENKKIEEDPDIRKLLLEALVQLCATRKCREMIRDQNTYYILRELHKIEKDENVKLACENVVDILIKKEDEIALDNYKDIDVPTDVQRQIENE